MSGGGFFGIQRRDCVECQPYHFITVRAVDVGAVGRDHAEVNVLDIKRPAIVGANGERQKRLCPQHPRQFASHRPHQSRSRCVNRDQPAWPRPGRILTAPRSARRIGRLGPRQFADSVRSHSRTGGDNADTSEVIHRDFRIWASTVAQIAVAIIPGGS